MTCPAPIPAGTFGLWVASESAIAGEGHIGVSATTSATMMA
jgi:hypothetical protein